MPRAYSDQERQAIRQRLIETAQELFAEQGFPAAEIAQTAQ